MSDEANEETTERYVMEIGSDRLVVRVIDTKTRDERLFAGRDRLLRATEYCARQNRQDAAGVEPAPQPVATERYAIEINNDHTVAVIDTRAGRRLVKVFEGEDRLAFATEWRAEGNRRDALGIEPAPQPVDVPVTPRSFLAETLPTFARNQRQAVWHELNARLGETEFAQSERRARAVWHEFLEQPAPRVTRPAPHATRSQRLEAMLAEVKGQESTHLANLAEDARLLNRAASLRKRLETALSATQSAETAARVGEDTESVLKPLRAL